jgi:hypothetical protein
MYIYISCEHIPLLITGKETYRGVADGEGSDKTEHRIWKEVDKSILSRRKYKVTCHEVSPCGVYCTLPASHVEHTRTELLLLT